MRVHLLTIICVSLGSGLLKAQELPVSTIEQTDQQLLQMRDELDELTLTHGRLDYRLLETLEDLSNRLLDMGRFDEAHDVLDHAAQVARISEGLYTQRQFPFLLSKAENFVNRGDWFHARDLMDHLSWLLSRRQNFIDDELIESLMRLSDLHLRGVAEDIPDNQGYHFRAAIKPNELAVNAARGAWGRFDTRLPPLLYQLVLQYYMQHRAVDAGGTTGMSLRTYSESGLARTRGDAKRNYYYAGVRRLNEIRNVYLNQEQADMQAIALSDMYLADWHVLFADSEGAKSAYLRSFNGLVIAGIEVDAINSYFATPVLLPAPEFTTRWQEAVAAADSQTIPSNLEPETAQVADSIILSFQQWSASFPFVSAPHALYDEVPVWEQPRETAIFSFSLTGLEKFNLWNRGRYKTMISAARDLEVLRHNSSSAEDQEALHEKVRELRFRPKLTNGIPQTVNATLHYQMATAN